MVDREPDIEAEVKFLTTAEGGRHTPVRTGYRPNHDMGRTDETNDAMHEFAGMDVVPLGKSVLSRMRFLAPERQNGRLHVGMQFTIQEGSKIVGRGRILHVLNKAMKASPS